MIDIWRDVVPVELDDDDLAFAMQIAKQRNHKLELGVQTRKIDDTRSDLEIDYRGALGEIAVGKLLGLPVDDVERLSGDNGIDFVLPTGHTVDVKCGGKRGYHFALTNTDRSKFKADIGILCWRVTEKQVEVVGWTKQSHFDENKKTLDFGYGERLALEPYDLLPMRRITDYLEKER